MKRFSIVSLITSLMFCACSDDGDSSVNFAPTLTSTSSGSLMISSSDIAYSETDNSVSSSTNEDFSSSVEVASSSSENAISSSAGIDQPTFSKYISQFAEPDESSINFDSHVVAFNAGTISLKCEENMVSYIGEEELLVPLKPISEENIAECFPKTASLLKDKFSHDVKFYALIAQVGASPLFVVLNKITNDKIKFFEIHPSGENCILSDVLTEMMFLIADADEILKDKEILPYGDEFFWSNFWSNIWKCDESGSPPNVKSFGEWYSDSLL